MRTIDKSRITKTIGHLDDDTIGKVKDVIKETYVDKGTTCLKANSLK